MAQRTVGLTSGNVTQARTTRGGARHPASAGIRAPKPSGKTGTGRMSGSKLRKGAVRSPNTYR